MPDELDVAGLETEEEALENIETEECDLDDEK